MWVIWSGHCNSLQHTAVRRNTLEYVATHCLPVPGRPAMRGAGAVDRSMQHAAAHCNILQHTAAHCSTLQHAATHCSTLQHTAAHCSTLQHTTAHCSTQQHTAAHCSTMQHTAEHCITLHHTAVHCSTTAETRRTSATASSDKECKKCRSVDATHCNTLQQRYVPVPGRPAMRCAGDVDPSLPLPDRVDGLREALLPRTDAGIAKACGSVLPCVAVCCSVLHV